MHFANYTDMKWITEIYGMFGTNNSLDNPTAWFLVFPLLLCPQLLKSRGFLMLTINL